MPDPVRVGVTGSRYYSDRVTIRSALKAAQGRYPGCRMLLVHGKCDPYLARPRRRVRWQTAEAMPAREQAALLGADWHCALIAAELGWETEGHPADWARHGTSAGPVRNSHMVALGAAEWLAFCGLCMAPRCRKAAPHLSHGTTGCADLAEKAGIDVRRFTA